jgi:hypothetical protein
VSNLDTVRLVDDPEPLMSRVNTTGRMLSFGLGWPIGALPGGVVAQAADSPRAGMLAGGAVLVVAIVFAWSSPLRGERVIPASTAPE